MKESLKTRGIHHIRSSFVEEYVNLIMTNKVCRSEYTYVKGCICVCTYRCNCFYMQRGTCRKLVYQGKENDFSLYFPNFGIFYHMNILFQKSKKCFLKKQDFYIMKENWNQVEFMIFMTLSWVCSVLFLLLLLTYNVIFVSGIQCSDSAVLYFTYWLP